MNTDLLDITILLVAIVLFLGVIIVKSCIKIESKEGVNDKAVAKQAMTQRRAGELVLERANVDGVAAV